MVTNRRQLREEVLRRRGLVEGPRGKLRIKPPLAGLGPGPPEVRPGITARMRLIEITHGKPIEVLLVRGSVREVGRRLGINYSTVSKWRMKFGLADSQQEDDELL